VSYSGFVLTDGPTALGGTLAFATGATTTSPVGSHSITPSGLTSFDYEIGRASCRESVYMAGTTTVLARRQNVSTYGDGLSVTSPASSPISQAVNPARRSRHTNSPTDWNSDLCSAYLVSYSGFVLGESNSALGGSLAFATSAITSSPVGSHSITPSGLTSFDY